MSDEQLVIERMHLLYDAMIMMDIKMLNKILTDDYYLIHMTGYKQSKREWLEEISQQRMHYYSQKEEKIEVEINGDQAVVISQNRVDAKIYGSRNTWNLQLKSNLQKTNDDWLFTHTIASTY